MPLKTASQRPARASRTRSDPFEAVWQSEIVPLLEATPALTATTLLEEMQRRYPGQYDAALLRTLQRRVRTWSASYSTEREVYFAQAHPPGRPGPSDFTHATVARVALRYCVSRPWKNDSRCRASEGWPFMRSLHHGRRSLQLNPAVPAWQ
ncbi:hypothetical protein [Massilia genomosp. 1]|uniref:Uncharacterized protein n=1 Tax=Massilia genomosp. 1 TaxID=2609280 RepID=A0ABX0N509_9BURK|nr:hypothetical protein [Massilia genomosp. 1]NHZ66619.1 hypothetical protein [Massilia genomosp. 1]